MNSPRQQEMDKLQAIERQRDAAQQRLDERLPRQLEQLRARVCATKWRLASRRRRDPRAYTPELVDATAKTLRMEVGAFEYAAKEQNELLTRALFQLDGILSHGDAAIKDARKALVLSIQRLLERADALKARAAAFKQFAEGIIARLPAVQEDVVVDDVPMEVNNDEDTTNEVEAPATTSTDPVETMVTDDDADWEHVDASGVRPLFASDDEEDDESKPQTEQRTEAASAPMEDAVMVEADDAPDTEDADEEGNNDDEDGDDAEEEEEEQEEEDSGMQEEPLAVLGASPRSVCDDARALPTWRPYYQIQRRADGVYLVANLRGVDPRDVQVQAMLQQGVLRVVGVKYPTQKDILLSRLSGAPTFGHFEIVERFPPHMLNLENASQSLEQDGTLQVRLPFYFVQHPRVMRRVSPFQPHGLVVW